MKLKKEEEIKVLIVEPMQAPKVRVIKNDLKELQSIVGGYIECLEISQGITIICNEEGKLEGLPLNRSLDRDGEIYEIIAGTFIVAGDDFMSGEFCSLNDDELKEYYNRFRLVEFFMREGNKIKSLKLTEAHAVELGFELQTH